jgi:hypothetical protein
VEARSREHASHLVKVGLSMEMEEFDDDVDSSVNWDDPSPMDTLACFIDEIREVQP